MNRSRINLWLTGILVILPMIGTAYYLLQTTVPKEKKPAKGSPPAQWFSYPRSVEGIAVVDVNVSETRQTPVFSSRYGRIACYLGDGDRVKLIKKWWSRYEKRFYYRVTDGNCTGWVSEERLIFDTENKPETPAGTRE